MPIRHPIASISLAWIGTAASFTLDHVSVVVGVASGIAAIAASFFAITVSRKTARLKDIEIQEEEEKLRQLKLRALVDPKI